MRIGPLKISFHWNYRYEKRWFRWFVQRWTRGFDDRELWSLDSTITDFILPRLKAFKDHHASYPMGLDSEKWNAALDDMIKAMEIDKYKAMDKETEKQYNKGWKLFHKYFHHLWD